MTDFEQENLDIAIIGLSCKFPKSENVEEFWKNIVDGVDVITRSEGDANSEGVASSNSNYVGAAGLISDVHEFDAWFFGMTSREAKMADPQQRQLMMQVWRCLEDAGYAPRTNGLKTALFTSISQSSYGSRTRKNGNESIPDLEELIGIAPEFLATRIAYKLNLQGPALTVQTACSSSLVALHMACNSLLAGDCDMAIVGAASIKFLEETGYTYMPGGILSPTGICRPTDKKCDGAVPGDGVAAVIVRRLTDAISARDKIYAVIKGSAINNDGAAKAGFTAPSIVGQVQVIKEALINASLVPEDVSFIELHGTGTPVGDPIELSALSKVFKGSESSLSLGATKANIGHLDVAAGIAGVIKVALALDKKIIPPMCNFEEPSEIFQQHGMKFEIPKTSRPWDVGEKQRVAGVSSFGIGGTNAHLLLAEHVSVQEEDENEATFIVTLSAKNTGVFEKIKLGLTDRINNHPEECPAADIAFTLQRGRDDMPFRKAFVVSKTSELLSEFESTSGANPVECVEPKVCLMFPGQGSIFRGCSRSLYFSEGKFRSHLDHCFDQLPSDLLSKIKVLLLGEDEEAGSHAGNNLTDTVYQQPALFIFEYALAKFLFDMGIKPVVMIGHSLGEYTAAVISGALAFSDALTMLIARGEIMQKMPAGSMLAVFDIKEEELELPREVSIAARNGEFQIVLSGPDEIIEQMRQSLIAKGVSSKTLVSNKAFHSADVEFVAGELRDSSALFNMQSPNIPYVSNLTGDVISETQISSTSYWADHAVSCVEFGAGVESVFKFGANILIEVGPGAALAGLVALQAQEGVTVVALSPSSVSVQPISLYQGLATLWEHGVSLNWNILSANRVGKVISLPTYPFEQEWHGEAIYNKSQRTLSAPKSQIFDAVYERRWVKQKRSIEGDKCTGSIVYIVNSERSIQDEELLCAAIDLNESAGREIVSIIDISTDKDIGVFAEHYEKKYQHADMIVYHDSHARTLQSYDLDYAFKLPRIIVFFQQWKKFQGGKDLSMLHLLTSASEVEPSDTVSAYSIASAAAAKVIEQENPGIKIRTIDFGSSTINRDIRFTQLSNEFKSIIYSSFVAYRGESSGLVVSYTPVDLLSTRRRASSIFCQDGNFIIIDGLEGYGYAVAEYIVKNCGTSRLVLLSTSSDYSDVSTWGRKIAYLNAFNSKIDIFNVTSSSLSHLINSFSKIDGIINAGRLYKDHGRTLEEVDQDYWSRQIHSKVNCLASLLAVIEVDIHHVVLFSSLSTVLGGIGSTAYTAANSILERHLTSVLQDRNISYTCLAWDAWHINSGDDESEAVPTGLQKYGFNQADAIALLDFISTNNCGKELIVAADLEYRLSIWLPDASENKSEESSVARSSALRPKLEAIWLELLGLEKLHESDDFFECGGHSLLAIKMLSRIRGECGIEVGARIIFDNPKFHDLYDALLLANPGRDEPTDNSGASSQVKPDARRVMQEIWSEFLGEKTFSDGDDFFDLGGHSLLAIKMLARINEVFEVNLSIRLIFDYPKFEKIIDEVNLRINNSNTFGVYPKPLVFQQAQATCSAENQASKRTSVRDHEPAADLDRQRESSRLVPALSAYFFSAEQKRASQNYELILKAAELADRGGFEAVWLPERHFHKFGGVFPAPAILAAAIASRTRKIHIRAGSIIAPIHHPFGVAEEWSMIDSIAGGGRVGLAMAAGWSAADFYNCPENFEDRKSVLKSHFLALRSIWDSGAMEHESWGRLELHPVPTVPELPLWITAAVNPETFEMAGTLGANVLTHLIGHDLNELREKIVVYKNALSNSHPFKSGKVTVLVHTFVDDVPGRAETLARGAFVEYLKNFVSLVTLGHSAGEQANNAEDLQVLAERGVDRYLRSASLIGTSDVCKNFLYELREIGVDEVACLVDFGMPDDLVYSSIHKLSEILSADKSVGGLS